MAALAFLQLVPKWVYWVLLAVAVIIGVEMHGRHYVQKDFDAYKNEIARLSAIAQAANTARNEQIAIEQSKTVTRIQTGYKNEIAKIRADAATSGRLRIPANCPNTAGSAEAKGNAGNDAANPGTRLVSESTQRDFDALQLKVGEIFASCRALQDFVRSNGME